MTAVVKNRSVTTCSLDWISPVALAVGEQKQMQRGDGVPGQNDQHKQPPIDIGGGEIDDRQLDGEQDRDDDDADLDQPLQPDPLVDSRSHPCFPS